MEIRERAVRLVLEHQGEYPSQWAAISSIATKCGMTPETLRKWVRRGGVGRGAPPRPAGAGRGGGTRRQAVAVRPLTLLAPPPAATLSAAAA